MPTEIMMSIAQIVDQSLNEFIVMSYYLLPPVNHYKLTDLFSFYNYDYRLTGQSKSQKNI